MARGSKKRRERMLQADVEGEVGEICMETTEYDSTEGRSIAKLVMIFSMAL
jgi:hypothetical protein